MQSIRARLTEILEEAESKVNAWLGETHKYEFLWKTDPAQDLEAFVANCPKEELIIGGSENESAESVFELIGIDLGRRVRNTP